MNIYEKLAAVQQELKAPKNLYNSFGEYKYRSAEGILEAVKPVLKKYNATILIRDNIKEIGGKNYVEATVFFLDCEDMSTRLDVEAYAELTPEKKKLDASQLTGVASSYARKYALNGLLLIDDTKDADTDEYAKQTGIEERQMNKVMVSKADDPISQETKDLIVRMAKDAKVELDKILTKPIDQLTNKQAGSLIQSLRKRIGG